MPAPLPALLFVPLLAFPPFPQVTADPTEVLVDQPVDFSSLGTIDPDTPLDQLEFTWDFGDGAMATGPAANHAYAEPGAWIVDLTVSDGEQQAIATTTVYVLAEIAASPARWSAPLALDETNATLWVVNPDSDSITWLDIAVDPPQVLGEVSVCDHPESLALSVDQVLITCRDDDRLVLVDRSDASVLGELALDRGPRAVAVGLAGEIVVSQELAGRVTVFEPDLSERGSVLVGGEPRAIALPGTGDIAYVSHFLTRGTTASVSVIDLASVQVLDTLALPTSPGPDTPSSSRGYPNLLSALAIDPSDGQLWIGGLKSNTDRGLFLDGEPLTPESRVRGLFARVGRSDHLEPEDGRIDTNDADHASALAFSPLGRWVYVAHQGLGAVSVYDVPTFALFGGGGGTTVPFAARIEVGEAPRGIVVDAAGARAYVACELSRELVVLDLADPGDPELLSRVTTTSEVLDAEVALGKRLFHSSRPPNSSNAGYIACASCHPDGGVDGRTWDFTHGGEGLRNTMDLRGRAGTAAGALHWSANFDEVQDFENDIVYQFGGSGLAQDGDPPNPSLGVPNAGRSEELDALAAYVTSLVTPARRDRELDEDLIAQGRQLFESEQVGCAECHRGVYYTDGDVSAVPFLLHDVGTLGSGSGMRLGEPLTGLETPSLLGLTRSAPYLHDGSAATLRAVLVDRNPDDLHGVTSQLAEPELLALEEYLASLDQLGEPDDTGTGTAGETDTGGEPGADESATASCACSSDPTPPSTGLLIPFILLLLGSVRGPTRRTVLT